MFIRKTILTGAGWLIATMLPALATELVYMPVNPAHGGNPNNGPIFLSTAQAQNKYKDPSIKVPPELTALQQFNQCMQRSVLSRLSAAAMIDLIGINGKLVPGSIDTGDFRIVIGNLGGGVLHVTTTDKNTGENIQFQIGGK